MHDFLINSILFFWSISSRSGSLSCVYTFCDYLPWLWILLFKSTFKYWNIYRTHLAKSSILIDYQSFWITPLKKGFNLLLERNFQGLYNLIFKNGLFMGFILNPIPWVAFAIFYNYEVEQNYLIIFSSMMIAFLLPLSDSGDFGSLIDIWR